MQVILSCRRCSSETNAKDLFCQECGLEQDRKHVESIADSYGVGISDHDWPALGPDPLSMQVESPAVNKIFGQTYEFGNYQLDLEPIEDGDESACLQSEIASQSSSSQEITVQKNSTGTITASSAQKLNSPLLADEEGANKTKHLGMRGGWQMIAIDNAIVVVMLAFSVALGLFIYTSYKKEKQLKKTQLEKTVTAAAVSEDYQSIYRHLLASKVLGQLDDRKVVLFDEAAFRLGLKELQSGSADKAIEFFSQVSIGSKHYVRAQEIIFQHAAPRTAIAPTQEKQISKNRRKRTIRREPAEPAKLSEEAVLSIPVIEELKNNAELKSNVEAESNTPQDVNSSQSEIEQVATRKFSESEISQYNRLLGRYFAKRRKQSAGENDSPEAPSFREWLKEGKPSF